MRRVAIIGGGPGGAHCARRLAESGLEVTLFEARTSFEKPCGGGIPARGLESYPFLADPRLPCRTVTRCILVAPSGAEADFRLDEPLAVFSRADLHSFQIDRATAAGVRVVLARVAAFEAAAVPGGGWRLATTADGNPPQHHGPFDFLVAADGAAGFARRKLAGDIPRSGLSQSIGYFLPGGVEDSILLKFFAGLNGYLWVFPRTDHASAGICATLGTVSAAGLRDLMDAFLVGRYGREVLKHAGRYAALIPGAPADLRGGRLQGDGWALVGDTGRSVDPLTREGIYFAMRSADLLAEALAAGCPGAYARRWSGTMGRELSWAARHAEGFFEARFVERLVGLCARSARTASILSDLVSGRQPYRTLGLRLIANSPRIAWEVLRRGPGHGLNPVRGS